jgi:hypothetical protein
MNPTLRRFIASGIALLCGGWMLAFALLGVGYGLTSWSKTPVESVFAFTAALLLGGLGVAMGCLAVQMLAPANRPAARRGFEVLPVRREPT